MHLLCGKTFNMLSCDSSYCSLRVCMSSSLRHFSYRRLGVFSCLQHLLVSLHVFAAHSLVGRGSGLDVNGDVQKRSWSRRRRRVDVNGDVEKRRRRTQRVVCAARETRE